VKPNLDASAFTGQGLLDAPTREALARTVTAQFIADAAALRQRSQAIGATPVFVTQSAFAWNAGPGPMRGLTDTINVHGTTLNYADVSFLHQRMNAGLMAWCRDTGAACHDAAGELPLAPDDFYDFVHTNPVGARKFGEYLAARLQVLLASAPKVDSP
jgi:hypothetical protein